jgi:hypothetical protein
MQGSTGNGFGRVQGISRRVVRGSAPSCRRHRLRWRKSTRLRGIVSPCSPSHPQLHPGRQDGVLLPKPECAHSHQPGAVVIVDRFASAFARALGRFYPFASRLVLLGGERGADDNGSTATVPLRCTGEGAEFVHAAALGVTAWAPLCIPRELVSSLFPLNGLLCVDAASSEPDADGGSRRAAPLLAAQVTELADDVFVAKTW